MLPLLGTEPLVGRDGVAGFRSVRPARPPPNRAMHQFLQPRHAIQLCATGWWLLCQEIFALVQTGITNAFIDLE